VHAVGNLSCVSTIGDLLDEGGVRSVGDDRLPVY